MANNNFKPFAAAAGANVMAQADYEALAALLTGFQSGTAQSQQLNKVWRQSSIMAAVLAQFIVDLTGQDAIDDGTTATLLANLKMAVQAQSAAVIGQCRNVLMGIGATSSTATLTADEIVVGTALGGQKYLLKQFSKTINLGITGAGGMDTGSAPASGFVALYAIYNPMTGASALLATNATSTVAPNVYGGANMPSGYTASALVSVWRTSGSQFVLGYQRDRRVTFPNATALNSSTATNNLTTLSIAGVVPLNATAVSGTASAQNSSTSAMQMLVATNNQGMCMFGVSVTATSLGTSFSGMLMSEQKISYLSSSTAGTPSFLIYINGYDF